ncbi:hypothetical protein N7466_010635 [Penicillium verhagenii]|uniref:uncharacterized protein n=1 Tax=Penicillium verhagenii TaxID=1562060 RepID=UPI0025453ED5|nr:uncharacterized protein N7466_010635 [Penicillium verhagenii]KAJ5918643.1 hypothetical protein N7466_010635 [Penicillium verhagenii]
MSPGGVDDQEILHPALSKSFTTSRISLPFTDITNTAIMSSLNERFEAAAADVKNLKAKPTDNELLELYGLYKQATTGDNDTTKPGAFSFKEKYKWEAWTKVQGKTQDEAKEDYIKLVDQLKASHGF